MQALLRLPRLMNDDQSLMWANCLAMEGRRAHLFVELRNPEAGKDPGARRWKNFIVTKVDPLLYIGCILRCAAL